MKKILLFAFLISCSCISNAQFTKGDKSLGGYVTLGNQNSSNENGDPYNKTSQIGIVPSFGYFIGEKTAIGILAGYTRSHYHSEDSHYGTISESTYRAAIAGMFVDQYFELSEHFLFSLSGQARFNRRWDKSSYVDPNPGYSNEDITNSYSLELAVRPVFTFLPSRRWAFEASFGSLGYSYGRSLSTDATSDSFGLNYGGINLGLRHFFRQ